MDPASDRCFLTEHGWTWVGPSPWAWRRGLSSLWVSGLTGVPWIHVPVGSLEHHVCLCSWHCCGKATPPHKNRNPGLAGDRGQVPHPGQHQDCLSWPASAPGGGERPAPLSFMNHGGSFLVEPCSSNWKGAGNPSVWRALEPLFERSVIFQSNSLLKPAFIKYSWDPFSPGTPSPRLSPKNQSGSSACSNASAFSGAWGCHLLPPPPSVPVPSPGSGDGWGCAGRGSSGKAAGRSGMGAGVMQQQQEDAATLWGRAGAAPLYQDLSRVPTLCWARGSFWPPWPEPLMDLPSWSMHGGPRAAAAPSPPLPRLPSGAFDPGPAVNGFVTALQPPHGRLAPGPAKGPGSWHGNGAANRC